MSEQLMDLIKQFGGSDAITSMAARVGLSPEQTQSAMAALMPAVTSGMSQTVANEGPAALNAAAAQAATVDHTSAAGVAQGSSLLGKLFGSSDVTEAVTQHAAAATGIDQGKIASLLPMLATLASGALAHGASGAVPAGGAAEGGMGGMLGGLLSRFTGGAGATAGAAPGAAGAGGAAGLLGMLDANHDGNVMDDIMGMVGKFRR